MLKQKESDQHRRIKLSLANDFRKKDWKVRCIDDEGEQTIVIENKNGVGDRENKRPDIDAKDISAGRIIRGEVKVNNGDFESEHSITQYKLFSDLNLNGVRSWLILGVPQNTKGLIGRVLDRELNNICRANVFIWEY